MERAPILSLLILLAGAAGLPAQEPAEEAPPTFPAEIEQVIVDVVVVDKKGNPVGGLTRDDMIVLEDGITQTIDTFEAIELPAEPAPVAAAPPPVSTNTTAESQRGRTFVIIFDDLHTTPQRARGSKVAVASFLEDGVREGDMVTLIASSGDVWWTARMNSGRDKLIEATKRLTGRKIRNISNERMTEWEALQIHVYRNPDVMRRVMRRYETYGVTMPGANDPGNPLYGTVDDPFVAANAQGVYYESSTRNRILLEVLERALNGLRGARGRKSVILVSEGFVYDPQQAGFRSVKEASQRANAAVYFVNSRGLETFSSDVGLMFGPAIPAQDMGRSIAGERFEAAAGTESIADDTGGFTVRNTNDLEHGIQRIANETRIYYLLGYRPTATARDGKYRGIDVKLREGKGLKVRARKGYYAPTEDGQSEVATLPGVDPVFQAALDSPWAEDGIPLRMTTYVGSEKMLGKAESMVVAEVDIRSLQFEEVDGRSLSEVEFILVVTHLETGEYFNYNQKINLKLRPSTREMLGRVWFPIIRDFELAEGDHQAKIVVKETTTGVVGSVVHEFEVLPMEEFRVSTPVLSDTLRKSANEERPQPQLLARREFPQDATLLCQFEVYGAERGDDGMPRVIQGYEIRRADGALQASRPETAITPSSLGHLSRMVGVPLQSAAPGDYEITLTLRDEVAGKSLELREPFTVVPSRPAPTGTDGDSDSPGR